MEQQLLNALKTGKLDEIATEMLAARIKVATQELDIAVHDFAEKIAELYKQYGTEYRLSGATTILYYKDKLFEALHPEDDDMFEVAITNGYRKFVVEARDSIDKLEAAK